jgi:glycosyltransferase involved in cell wall biosynthesis
MNDKHNKSKEAEVKTPDKKRMDYLQQLEQEIEIAQKQHVELKQKHDTLQSEFDAVRHGLLWRQLQSMKKLKRFMKLGIKYIVGKRDRREIFNRSLKAKKARNRIKKLKYNLYELGFTEKALEELERESFRSDNPYVRKYAAWELAVWHANQYNVKNARKCLEFLSIATKGEKNRDFLRRSVILEVESYAILNEVEKAQEVIAKALASHVHADLYLAAANLETTDEERLKWINKALALYDMEQLQEINPDKLTPYDGLTTSNQTKVQQGVQPDQPKVTIIIPSYNAEKGIQTALDSVLGQTWRNLEVIVADDCSTDGTKDIVTHYMAKDKRVQLISTATNSGAYTARNEALKMATGEFVTINDADDWSHPGKIAEQVNHLLGHDHVIANTTEQARATEDMIFYRRGKPGVYLFANMSSLMFRRKPVLQKLGYWDSVRFGADGEFKKRLKICFGDEAVVDLKTGPYSFQRQSVHSLTGNQVFGYHGFFMGARKEYAESHANHHRTATTLKYDFPQESRLFPVPEPMLPTAEAKSNGRRHFDVIIASEFRLLGGTNMSNIEEIKAQQKLGLKTGLVQMSRYDLNSVKTMNPKVRELIDGDQVQMLVYGEQVSCDVLIVRHPPILQEWQKYIPDIKAYQVRVIVNQPPRREYSEQGKTLYNIPRCADHLEAYTGNRGKWYPIGPRIRETLNKYHEKDLKRIDVAQEDWINIIDVAEWRRESRPQNKKIRIGRHSRDQYVKWPIDKEELLKIYPSAETYQIDVLGGAKAAEKVLGSLPANWHVKEFGDVHPKDFLADIDVFVYYTHPQWVEAFGRVIFEAIAVGVPVIIPPSYQSLFGEAAIYAEPDGVKQRIDELMEDQATYQKQVEIARNYVEKHFGYLKHASRLEECFIAPNRYIFHE